MSEIPPHEMQRHLPGYDTPAGRVGVIDAMRMSWQLVRSDLLRLWLLGLVLIAINLGMSIINSIPYLGSCTSLATGLFVQPALAAGLFYALLRRIDTGRAEVGDLFGGFRYRYWPSVLVNLIVVGIVLGAMIVLGIVFGGLSLVVALATDAFDQNEPPIALILCLVLGGVVSFIVLLLLGMHFMFALLAIWDHPQSAWEAVKTSIVTGWRNLLSVVGLVLIGLLISVVLLVAPGLFGLMIAYGASENADAILIIGIAGLAVCGLVYVVLVFPVLAVWYNTWLIYLYRSWTGQPLVQPITEAPPVPPAVIPGSPFPPRDAMPPVPPDLTGGPEGPVPPTDIEPPA